MQVAITLKFEFHVQTEDKTLNGKNSKFCVFSSLSSVLCILLHTPDDKWLYATKFVSASPCSVMTYLREANTYADTEHQSMYTSDACARASPVCTENLQVCAY